MAGGWQQLLKRLHKCMCSLRPCALIQAKYLSCLVIKMHVSLSHFYTFSFISLETFALSSTISSLLRLLSGETVWTKYNPKKMPISQQLAHYKGKAFLNVFFFFVSGIYYLIRDWTHHLFIIGEKTQLKSFQHCPLESRVAQHQKTSR